MYSLLYGKSAISFALPEGRTADIISYQTGSLGQTEDIVNRALASPVSSPRLRELTKDRQNAVILISDMSRLCPSHLFLENLLMELNAGGIPDSNIRIVVALGMHRKQTQTELKELAGTSVFERVPVSNHSAHPDDCVHVGTTSRGTPIEINRHVAEADLRIATGNIEPHRLAGMSGGLKALVPGCASTRCIEANHSLSRITDTVPGDVNSPIRWDLEEAHSFVPIHFLFNVIVNHRRELLDAVAGHPIEAHRAGLRHAAELFFVDVPKDYDIVIVSPGGHPKDSQMYQAVKSLQNAAAIAKPGASVVMAAQCPEHFGNGIFQYWVETVQDREKIASMLKETFVLGAHKISHIEEVLKRVDVYLYSDMPASSIELLGFRPVADLQETIHILLAEAGSQAKVAVMPYGALTFPKLLSFIGKRV